MAICTRICTFHVSHQNSSTFNFSSCTKQQHVSRLEIEDFVNSHRNIQKKFPNGKHLKLQVS